MLYRHRDVFRVIKYCMGAWLRLWLNTSVSSGSFVLLWQGSVGVKHLCLGFRDEHWCQLGSFVHLARGANGYVYRGGFPGYLLCGESGLCRLFYLQNVKEF